MARGADRNRVGKRTESRPPDGRWTVSRASPPVGLDKTFTSGHTSAAPPPSARRDRVECEERELEVAQFGLLVAAWTVSFLLGKELQTGFAQWRDRKS